MGTLTNTLVREAKPRSTVYELTCTGLPGFVLRVLPTGKKVFVVRQRVGGKDRRVRIGPWGPSLTVEEARRRAAVILGGGTLDMPASPPEFDEDEQPRPRRGTRLQRREDDASLDLTAQRATTRAASSARTARSSSAASPPSVEHVAEVIHLPRVPRPAEPTLRQLAERYSREYIDVYLKPGSASNYRHYLDAYILPALGDRPFTQVSRSDVLALHASLRKHPAAGDYVLCVLGSLYTRIIRDWELADIRNPVSNTKRYGSRRVERFLTPDERTNLEAVLQRGVRLKVATKGYVEPMAAWALRLLAHTGLRKDEILSLQWPMVDWQHAVFNLRDSKTGPRSVPVSSQVMTLLREIQTHTGHPRRGYVIHSRTGRRLTSLDKTWERIRVLAGIPDVRLHDLRHSFASDALMGGVPLAVIGKILGHRQPTTTQRYAHLSDRVVRDAVEHTSSRIADAAPPSPSPTILPFKPLTNVQWAKVSPIVLAGHHPRTHARIRKSLDGVRWILHHNAPWQKLPPEYGTSTTCWRWYKRWQEEGQWDQIVACIDSRR